MVSAFFFLSRQVENPMNPAGFEPILFFPLLGLPFPDARVVALPSVSEADLGERFEFRLSEEESNPFLACVADVASHHLGKEIRKFLSLQILPFETSELSSFAAKGASLP